jgi:hypothetical protein
MLRSWEAGVVEMGGVSKLALGGVLTRCDVRARW